jgi:hypothetical protein
MTSTKYVKLRLEAGARQPLDLKLDLVVNVAHLSHTHAPQSGCPFSSTRPTHSREYRFQSAGIEGAKRMSSNTSGRCGKRWIDPGNAYTKCSAGTVAPNPHGSSPTRSAGARRVWSIRLTRVIMAKKVGFGIEGTGGSRLALGCPPISCRSCDRPQARS